MIRKVIGLKKYLLSKIKIRKLVHYKKELSSDDFSAQQATSSFDGDIVFQHYPKASPEILNLFHFEGKDLIEENTACIVAKIKDDPAGCIFFDLQPLAKLLAPFKYGLKLGANSAYIHGLFVEKKFRGQGLAKLLYIQAFKLLERKFKYAHVLIEEGNYITNNMVREIGFEKCGSFALIKIFQIELDYATNNVFEKGILSFIIYLVKGAYRIIRFPISIAEKISVRKNKSSFKLFILSDLKSGEAMTVAYFCKTSFYLSLANRIFPGGYKIKKSKTFLKSALEKEIQEITNDVDLLIIEDKFRYLSKRFKYIEDATFIPKLVLQKNVNFRSVRDFEAKKNSSLNSDLKAVRNKTFDYIFMVDSSALTFFYDRMYVPFIKNRHNHFAFISEFNLIRKSFKKGGLIFLKQGNKFLSGGVVEIRNKELDVKYFGVLDGNTALLKKDVLSSLYYFCFKLAQEKSIEIVNFGYSRGFLNDGILRYKAKWNTKVYFDRKQPVTFLLKIHRFTPAIKNFLLNNPFISIENKMNLIGNVFLDNENSNEKQTCINRYKVDGLNKLRIAYLNGLQGPIKEETFDLKTVEINHKRIHRTRYA